MNLITSLPHPFYTVGYQIAAISSLSVILFFCLWSIHSDRVRDGLIGRILYGLCAVGCVAGILHMLNGTYPQRTTITIFVCVAMLVTRRMFIHYFWDEIRRRYFFQLKRYKAHRRNNDI